MSRTMYFTIEVEIDDEETLRLAAEERAVAEGTSLEDWRETRDGAESDLVMLLDPGTLPGCSVLQSYSGSSEDH
jgi:hypothetical protein